MRFCEGLLRLEPLIAKLIYIDERSEGRDKVYSTKLATTEYIYYLHDSDDVLMVGLENRQTIARGDFAMDSYQESFENIYYGNSYEEEIWMDEYEKDAKTQELESNEMEL